MKHCVYLGLLKLVLLIILSLLFCMNKYVAWTHDSETLYGCPKSDVVQNIYCITEFCVSIFVFLYSWMKKLLSLELMNMLNCSMKVSQRRSGVLLLFCNLLAILIIWKSFYTMVFFSVVVEYSLNFEIPT